MDFFFTYSINSSFSHLESLVLNYLQYDELLFVLIHLISLPRLYSLTISISSESVHLTLIYQIIFQLSKLKYYKLTSDTSNDFTLPSSSINEQFSSIEHLVIHHRYTFEQLQSILSYIPQLRHLNLMHRNNVHLTFDQFEIFIKNRCSQLNILSMSVSKNITYLDPHRWEQLILQYLPQLKRFYLKYEDHTDEDYEYPIYAKEINQFTTSFWIQRNWSFQAEINFECINYFITPSKKRWYDDFQAKSVDISIKSSRLMIGYIDEEYYDFLVIDSQRVLFIETIYHLEISVEQLDISLFIRTIDFFPQLQTLKIHSLSLNNSKISLENHITKIKKVYLKESFHINEVYLLMTLCPYMKYLKIDSSNYLSSQWCLEMILYKILDDSNQYLRLLCIHFPNQHENLIQDLEEMINFGQLLVNYTIKRIADEIYLEWK